MIKAEGIGRTKEKKVYDLSIIICVGILSIIILSSILAPLSPHNPDEINPTNKLAPMSRDHLFGTDELGRDYFTRTLYGGRISLTVGVVSMLISVTIGTFVGTISGYIGGTLDNILMRIIDILMSIPSFLLIVIINTILSPSMITMILTISLFSWMGIARIVRAQTMSLKEEDFILASKNLGASGLYNIVHHIIPNMASQIIVAATLNCAGAILTESSLSFLGFGVQLPKSSWGSMLKGAQKYILDLPLLSVFPGILILLTILSFNVLGDKLLKRWELK